MTTSPSSRPEAGSGPQSAPAPSGGPGRGTSRVVGVTTSLLRMRELSVVVVVIALFVYFSVSNSGFYSLSNLGNVADATSAAAILAAGEVMLLVCGEIDLSVGMTFALTPFVMMSLNNDGLPLIVALIVALVVAALIGVFNGLVTVWLGLPSFITTLGTLFLIHGITLKTSGSFPQPAPTEGLLPHILGAWRWSEILWAIAIALVMQVVLTNTRWGAYTIATGGNPVGAAEAGIKTRRIKVAGFVTTAVFGGFAGILDGITISHNFDPNAGGNDLMFTAVAAAVIGGTTLLGGSGTVIGAFFGAALLGILEIGFTLQGISATSFIIIEGIAIIVAMILNIQLGKLRREAKAA